MKRLLIAAIILLLWASPAMAIEPDDLPEFSYEIGQIKSEIPKKNIWNETDYILFMLRFIDLGQTLYITGSTTLPEATIQVSDGRTIYRPKQEIPNGYEMNPLLGKHPSKESVILYFISLMTLDRYLDHKSHDNPNWLAVNKWWKRINIGAELYCVNNNYRLGFGWGF